MVIRSTCVAVLFGFSLTFFAGSDPAMAGNSCREHQSTVLEFRSAVEMASRLRAALNRTGDRVALVARVGSDISAYGLKYTHLGIARKRTRDGEWEVVQQLNPCGTATSILRVHGLANFMLDDLHTHDIRVIRLNRGLVFALNQVLAGSLPLKVYEPRYNMISYPGLPALYQNSNQWILEIIVMAQALSENRIIETREETHRHYRAAGFKGSSIRISALRRAFARMGAQNVRFDDHPSNRRNSGLFEVVSVKSIATYLASTGDLSGQFEITGAYTKPTPKRPTESQHHN